MPRAGLWTTCAWLRRFFQLIDRRGDLPTEMTTRRSQTRWLHRGVYAIALLGLVGACRPACVVGQCGDQVLLIDAGGDLFFAQIRQIQPLATPGEWQEGAPSVAANFLIPTPGLIDSRVQMGDYCVFYDAPMWESEPANSGLVLRTNLQTAMIQYNSGTGLNDIIGLVGGPVIDPAGDSLRMERDGEVVTEVLAPGVPWDATSHFGAFMGADTLYKVPVTTNFDVVYSFTSGLDADGMEVGLRCVTPREDLVSNGDHYEMPLVSDDIQMDLETRGVMLTQMTVGYTNFEMTDDAVEGHETALMLGYFWQLQF